MSTAFVRAVDRIALLGGRLAAAMILLMAGHILIEIFLRSLLATSTYVLDEFVGYAVAAATFLGAGYTLRGDGFIRVGLLLHALEGARRLRRALELVCIVAGLVAAGGLLWYFAQSAQRHFERGTVSETIAQVPMWVPEGAVVVGLLCLVLSLAACLVEVLAGGPLLCERHAVAKQARTAVDMRER